MDVPRVRPRLPRHVAVPTLIVAAALAMVSLLLAGPARADSGSWGATGASYTDGIICQPNAATAVPLASWSVNGSTTAFAVDDIEANGGLYGPAPTSGASVPIGGGVGGITGTDVGAVAYLIGHHTSSSPAVAETSADIAAVNGGGGLQAQCLQAGAGGATTAGAAAALADARRYGGPYTVQVSTAANPLPGTNTTVRARIVSATGNATPGIAVSFSVNGSVASATTDATGVAGVQVPVPTSPVPVEATVTEATSLTYFGTTPPSVALAAPTAQSGTGTLQPAAPPQPVLKVSSTPLVLADGSATPSVALTGTNGYSGTGTITLTGPVHPAAGHNCDSLNAANFTSMGAVWTGTFSFTGDGTEQAGASPTLVVGCYAASASVQTTNSSPPVSATSAYRQEATTAVTTLKVAESTSLKVATPGTISTTITASDPGTATVSSQVIAYGPVSPRNGSCDGLTWTSAARAGTSASRPLTATSGATKLAATIAAPEVSNLGCYALSARSQVSQDGRTATVQESVGRPGATTLVTIPTLTVSSSSLSGTQGKPMTGTVTVLGSYTYAGTVSIGLRSGTPASNQGCRQATFQAVPERVPPTAVATKGDGTYSFSTPIPALNRCYAITATLSLTANPLVLADSPPPTQNSIFLAGALPVANAISEKRTGDGGGLTRTVVALAVGVGLVLVLSIAIMARAYVAAKENDGLGSGWRPYRGEDDLDSPQLGPDRPRPHPGPLP